LFAYSLKGGGTNYFHTVWRRTSPPPKKGNTLKKNKNGKTKNIGKTRGQIKNNGKTKHKKKSGTLL
jgi:hypothetical protein